MARRAAPVRPYRFHREARAEYRDALAWYATRSIDVADGFADVVTHGIRGICQTPEAWPMWSERAEVRVRVTHRYPYLIAYIIRDSQIVILAVAHQHRQPGYWLSRLPPELGPPV